MQKECENFLNDLDLLIQSKHVLNHPFYHAWSNGELSKECLRDYAKEYYHHVKAFPTYLSAIHARTENQDTRKVLLQNLVEEEAGSPNHPELWKQFAMSLGATEADIAEHKPNAEIQKLIATFKEICNQHTIGEGIASLYAYESQIPAVCISKIDGLKKFYGMQNPADWEYFRVHIHADEVHAAEERTLLKQHVNAHNMPKALNAADRILDALWGFLSGMCDRHNISCRA